MARTAITARALARDTFVNNAALYEAFDDTNDMYVPATVTRGPLVFHFKNTNGSTRTITFKAGDGDDLGPSWRKGLGDLTVTIGATTGEQIIYLNDLARFRQDDGTINVDCSGSNVTVAMYVLGGY